MALGAPSCCQPLQGQGKRAPKQEGHTGQSQEVPTPICFPLGPHHVGSSPPTTFMGVALSWGDPKGLGAALHLGPH